MENDEKAAKEEGVAKEEEEGVAKEEEEGATKEEEETDENTPKEEEEGAAKEDETDEGIPNETPNDASKDDDLALLEETRKWPSKKEIRRNKQLDSQITSQSEEAQAAFLQGAIPKVVFEHAMTGGQREVE